MKNGEPLPQRVGYIALLDRMNCNWFEYRKMPKKVVDDYLIYMKAEHMVRTHEKGN